MWTFIIEIVLSLLSSSFKYFKSSDEKLKWLNKFSVAMNKKGWARTKFIQELEKDSSDYIDKKMQAAQELENDTKQKDS